MHSKQAAVVIPIYKAQYSAYELISIAQCFKVLKNYPVIFVKPNSLSVLPTVPPGAKFEIISFDDSFFADINGYNKLMLSEGFYGSFSDYEFILIHQMDAFVFTDQLSYWCNQGYDYIGAPWISENVYTNFVRRIKERIKNYLYVRYNAKYKDGMPKIGKQLENRVGNGGFSLRRAGLFANYCKKFKPLADKYIAMQHPSYNEDVFWSLELNRKRKNVKVPGFNKSLHFAFELYPDRAIEKTKGQLPFGCHAWDKEREFWQPIFKKEGYDI